MVRKNRKKKTCRSLATRLAFFGHVCRLPETTPVNIALCEALRPSKKPRGRPKTTYLQVIKTLKVETLSNIRGRNDGSKRQRKMVSNRQGPKLFSG